MGALPAHAQGNSYGRFLDTANRATRQATPEQRAAMRALVGLHLPHQQMTEEIEKIMGWDQ